MNRNEGGAFDVLRSYGNLAALQVTLASLVATLLCIAVTVTSLNVTSHLPSRLL